MWQIAGWFGFFWNGAIGLLFVSNQICDYRFRYCPRSVRTL